MKSVNLDSLYNYAVKELQKAKEIHNIHAMELTEKMLTIIQSWAEERKEAANFYEDIRKL